MRGRFLAAVSPLAGGWWVGVKRTTVPRAGKARLGGRYARLSRRITTRG